MTAIQEHPIVTWFRVNFPDEYEKAKAENEKHHKAFIEPMMRSLSEKADNAMINKIEGIV